MKLQDLFEFEIPLTVTSLRAWPNPGKTGVHSGQMTVKVDPDKHKVNLPTRKKRRVFFDKSLKAQTSGGLVKEDANSAREYFNENWGYIPDKQECLDTLLDTKNYRRADLLKLDHESLLDELWRNEEQNEDA